MLPLLSSRWSLMDKAAGSLFTSQFLGSMVGTLLSGTLIRRIGLSKTLTLGYLLMAVYALAVWHLPWPYLLALLFANGLALGFVIPATNMAISDSFPDHRAAALNLINLAWSLGAIACPTFLAGALRLNGLSTALNGISIISVAVAVLVLRRHSVSEPDLKDSSDQPLPKFPLVVLAGLFFLYIGAEGAVAGWLATYTKRTVFSSGVLWMTAPSYFWAAMMVGRAFAPIVLRKVSERSVVVIGLTVAAAGVFGIQAGSTPVEVLSAAAVTGVGMSGIFPIFIAMASYYFGDAATRASAYLFAMAALGGAVLPWLVGVISSHTGSLQTGLLLALAGVLAQLGLFAMLVRTNPAIQRDSKG